MRVISVRNVHQALPEAAYQLINNGRDRASRNGPVKMFDGPVMTVYSKPYERVLFWPERDANPFFHLMECIWMVAGRRDVEFVSRYNSHIKNFSDDGEVFNAAYGHRWRVYFKDQLGRIAEALRENPDCRRQVLAMWDANHDLGLDSKDLPCNTHAYFQVNCDGDLDMFVSCRSNDLVWGCYGANAVHFSFLHEFMAGMVGVAQGRYYHLSMNLHAYWETHGDLLERMAEHAPQPPSERSDPYTEGRVKSYYMQPDAQLLSQEADAFCEDHEAREWHCGFLQQVALPIAKAWRHFKDQEAPNRYEWALGELSECYADDWRVACIEWLRRRRAAWEKKNG